MKPRNEVTGKELARTAAKILRAYQVFPLVMTGKNGFVVLDGKTIVSLAASLVTQAKDRKKK